jgi:hypothetical protein
MESLRGLSDEQLLAQCRLEAYRGPGPGGQKRNKTSSAIRITHLASGINAIAGESRSQSRNKSTALRRLRLKLALKIRQSWKPDPKPNLETSPRSEDFPLTVGIVLDVLADAGWSVSDAAEKLGATTAQLAKFLRKDGDVLSEVNQMRAAQGLKRLG